MGREVSVALIMCQVLNRVSEEAAYSVVHIACFLVGYWKIKQKYVDQSLTACNNKFQWHIQSSTIFLFRLASNGRVSFQLLFLILAVSGVTFLQSSCQMIANSV